MARASQSARSLRSFAIARGLKALAELSQGAEDGDAHVCSLVLRTLAISRLVSSASNLRR
jgi:hypothetical protein